MMRSSTPTCRRFGVSRGFTLVELLVVIVIIGLLIGIAAPAFFKVRRGAKVTAAETMLQNLSSGIDAFRNDFGYLPPLILDDPEIAPTENQWCTTLESDPDTMRRERYHSIYSLPVYLVGVGGLNPDPALTNDDRHDGKAGPGLRDPGIDRAWGGAKARTVSTHRVTTSGRVYGPYVNVSDGERLRKASALEFDFPEDVQSVVAATGPWDVMSVITDDWGTAIRYYRNWPTRADGQTNRSLLEAPAEIVLPSALRDGPVGGTEFDASRDPELARGEYALLSAGPDRKFAPDGFASQGSTSMGSVEDFFADEDQRAKLLANGLEDNIRLVK